MRTIVTRKDLKGLKMNSDFKADFKNILIIKYGAFSEIIASLSVINSLKNFCPDAKIHLFTEEIPATLLSCEKSTDEIFSVNNLSYKNIFKSAKDLKSKKFDLVIDLNASLKSYLLSILIGAKNVITVEKDTKNPPAERFFKAISEKINGFKFVNDTEIHISQTIRDVVQTAIQTDKEFVILSTQTAKTTEGRKYRLEKFKELAEKIIRKYDVEIYFVGTANERSHLKIFENLDENIHNFAGRFNILEFAAFAQKAKCVIGIDSAPIYIAKSVHTPTIALFGANSAKNKGFSGTNTYTVQSKKLSCIPCNKDFCKLRNEEYSPCMDDILTEEIIEIIEKNNMLPKKMYRDINKLG